MTFYTAQTGKPEKIKATFFMIFLITFFAGSLFTAYISSGPIVLGTEMNTNGMVEYMCLGNDCEHLNSFSWFDK